jgi:hypothetical protein
MRGLIKYSSRVCNNLKLFRMLSLRALHIVDLDPIGRTKLVNGEVKKIKDAYRWGCAFTPLLSSPFLPQAVPPKSSEPPRRA